MNLVEIRKRPWAERCTLLLPYTSRLLGFCTWHSVIPRVQRDCREKRTWISSQLRACLSQTVCQNHLSLPEKDVGKGVCFRCPSLSTVVRSCASLIVIDHAKCFKLAKRSSDLYHVLAGIRRELIKASFLLWHFLLPEIHLVFNTIAGNPWRIGVVMRIIHKEALCCWELLVPQLQWGLSRSGWNTLPRELLRVYVWGLAYRNS